MKDIQDIVRLFSSPKMPRHTGIKNLTGKSTPLLKKFVQGIGTKAITDDQSARLFLYGETNPGPKYDMLKRRLRSNAYSSLITFNYGEREGRKSDFSEHNCIKYFMAGRILLSLGADVAGKRALHKALTESARNQYYKIAFLSAEIFMSRAYLTLDAKKYFGYKDLYELYLEKYRAEQRTTELHETWMLLSFGKKGNKDEIDRLAGENTKEINSLYILHQTNTISHTYFRNKIFYHQQLNEFEQSLEACFEYEKYLQKDADGVAIRRAQCLMLTLDNCIYLNRMGVSFDEMAKIQRRVGPGTYNSQMLLEMYMALCINTGSIEDAARTFSLRRATGPNMNSTQRLNEKWSILEGFLYLCLKLQPDLPWPQGLQTNASKIANEVSALLKEKNANKTTLITLQVLFALLKKDFERIYGLEHIIQNMISKELNAPESRRSRIMLQIVQKLQRKNFGRSPFVAAIESLRERLSSEKNIEGEVVRYEKITALLIDLIDD